MNSPLRPKSAAEALKESNDRILFNELRRVVQRLTDMERDLVLTKVLVEEHERDVDKIRELLRDIQDDITTQRALMKEVWCVIQELKKYVKL